MAFRPSPKAPDLDRLQSVLMNTGLQTKDNPTFQVLKGLIDAAKRVQDILSSKVDDSNADITTLENQDFLTALDDSLVLPNARQLIAGTNVTFDDSVAGRRTVNTSGGPASGYWTLLTDGDSLETEFIFDSNGDVISMFVPL